MAKTDTDKLVESLGGMTVLELVELKNKLEEEWGVSAAAVTQRKMKDAESTNRISQNAYT